MINEGLHINGEFYASLIYKPMIDSGEKINIFEIKHFMQWGVPSDFEEYIYWHNTFKDFHYMDKFENKTEYTNLVPMVGLGKRFKDEGYELEKPMIEIDNEPIFLRSLQSMPTSKKNILILRNSSGIVNEVKKKLNERNIHNEIIVSDGLTDGQASTCFLGKNIISSEEGLNICSCDNGMIYNLDKFKTLLAQEDTDILVWTIRNYPGAKRNPQMYGWVETDQLSNIKSVSVKNTINGDTSLPIVLGAFTFKKSFMFFKSAESMFKREGKVNGEYYVDECINDAISLGFNCKSFEIDKFLCWGTPNDLRTFSYWKECFSSWDGHPFEGK